MPETILTDKSGRPIVVVDDNGIVARILGQIIPSTTFGRQVGAIAAIANLLTVNVPHDADHSYKVCGNVRPTIATTHAFTMTCSYTDEGGTARVLTLTFGNVVGGALSVTSIANAAGAVPYMGAEQSIRCKAGTTIVFATVGVFTTVTYNAEASATLVQ